MISLAEKIALSFPPMYFIISIFLLTMSDNTLLDEIIRDCNVENEDKLDDLIFGNLLKGLFNEFAVVSVINWISIGLVLKQPEIATILEFFGLMFYFFGHHYLDAELRLSNISDWTPHYIRTFRICFS